MTQEQAVYLWHQFTYEETVAATSDSGYECFSKTTPATALIRFIGVRDRINWKHSGGWDKDNCKEVAKFLREFADALEGEQS